MPCGASSRAQPERKTPTFFIDRSLGRSVISRGLRAAGAQVVVHDDRFSPDELDVVWLAEAGRQQWIVLTKDGRIRSRTLERIALMQAGVHVFFLASRQLTGREMAAAYVAALPAMLRAVSLSARPLWMSVHRDGRLTDLSQDA